MSYVFMIRKFNISMSPILNGYRVISGFIIHALL